MTPSGSSSFVICLTAVSRSVTMVTGSIWSNTTPEYHQSSAISEANAVNRAAQRAKESKKQGAYIKLEEKTKIRISKYSSENGIGAAARRFSLELVPYGLGTLAPHTTSCRGRGLLAKLNSRNFCPSTKH